MKASTLFLGASLAANAALVAGFLFGPLGRSPSASAPTVAPAQAVATTAADSVSGAATGQEWASLQTGDLAAQRDRLRAEGFPPAMIRAILAAQLRETFADRRKALESARGEIPYWKNPQPDPQTQAAMRALDRELQQAMLTLLGPDPENGAAATLQRQFPDLSADKVAQLAAIRDDYDRKRTDIYAARGALLGMSAEDGQKLADLDQAMHAEIASALTPQELEDYDLRTSNAASQLRSNLAAFDVTEQEFRTLFQLRQGFGDRLGPSYGPMSQDQIKARNDAQNELNDQIKAALGDDRFAEYQRATSYGYQQTSSLVARLGVPPETTNQLWAMQQDMGRRAVLIRGDRTLSPAERTEQIAALNDEATAKVTAALGEQGFAAYKQYGGSWLQTLQPPRPPPGAALGGPAMVGSGTMLIRQQ